LISCRDCACNRIAGCGRCAGIYFLDQIGLRPGRLHAWAAAFAETLGGLLLALGSSRPSAPPSSSR